MDPTTLPTSAPSLQIDPLVQQLANMPGSTEIVIHFLAFCLAVALVTEALFRILARKVSKADLYSVEKIVPLIIALFLGLIPNSVPNLPGPQIFYAIVAGGFCGQVFGIVKRWVVKKGASV